ncbi:hypothetical protein [Ursidibacter arcticus]
MLEGVAVLLIGLCGFVAVCVRLAVCWWKYRAISRPVVCDSL